MGRNWFILWTLTIFILTIKIGLAAENFEVTGIMGGDHPVAIVNGKMVEKGSVIDGAEVEEIGENSVTFKYQDGIIISRLGGGANKNNKDSAATNNQNSQDSSNGAAGNNTDTRDNENEKQADSYISDAKKDLEASIMTVDLYEEAWNLYDKAERELQYAFDEVSDAGFHSKIGSRIDACRDAKQDIYAKEEVMKDKIKDAIKNKKLVRGMTESDVVESWGEADKINVTDVKGEEEKQWVYGDTYLYFENGILTSNQYSQ